MSIHSRLFRGAPAILLAASAALAAAPSFPDAASAWRRLDTSNFTVAGNAGDRELASVATELERFREALSKLLPSRATAPIVPTVVLVFASGKELDPFKPLQRGKPIEAAGLVVPSVDLNYIAVAGGSRDLRRVFHEYVHLVTANLRLSIPLWLDEGLAEYYSTFELLRDGRRANVGEAIVPHLQLLRYEWLELPKLLALERGSPLHNEGSRRSVLYAQSWALVHFLLHGAPSRRDSLVKFMNAVEDGTPEKEAWGRLFGQQPIEAGLKEYVHRAVFHAAGVTLVEPLDTGAAAMSALSDGDVDGFLGDFLAHGRRQEDAAARLEPAAGRADGARARIALARVWARENRPAEARALLARTPAPSGDWLADYAAGVAAADTLELETPGEAASTALARDAREAMKRALAARPELAHGWHVLAGLALQGEADLDVALEAAEQARFLAPARAEHAVRLAEALVRRREYSKARQMLAPLLASPRATPVGDRIRSMLGRIADIERAAAEAPAPAPASDSSPPAIVLDLRRLRSGEERTGGMLARIDCAKAGLTLHVRVGDRTTEFRAPKMQDIEFVSYRDDLRGSVACGTRDPEDLVYVTWRTGEPAKTGAAPPRIAVAVEFLPTDYRLKP